MDYIFQTQYCNFGCNNIKGTSQEVSLIKKSDSLRNRFFLLLEFMDVGGLVIGQEAKIRSTR